MNAKRKGFDEAIHAAMEEMTRAHSGPDHELLPCPRPVADVILQILQTGVVQARSAGWSQDAELAAIEADHVHNLADLLRRYTLHKIKYYWNSERPAYIFKYARHMGEEPKLFDGEWERLELLVPKE